MAAVRPGPRAAEEQPPELKLGVILPIIHPWNYEKQFWMSPLFLDGTRDMDAFNLFTRICENWLFLFRSLSGIPDATVLFMRRQCQRNVTFAALHVALKMVSPELYEYCRWALVTHLRWALSYANDYAKVAPVSAIASV